MDSKILNGYIGVSGTIGVGKSTFTANLARALGFEAALEEPHANPYLPLFYQDMKAHVTKMQIWFLNYRVREHRQIVSRIRSGGAAGVVKDRTVWEDMVFAKMFNHHPDKILSDLDYKTYLDLFENMVLYDPVFPCLLVYLDCRPETALKRIRRRNRDMEKALSLEYLRELKSAYDKFVQGMEDRGVRVLRLDWERFVPVPEVADEVRRCFSAPFLNPSEAVQAVPSAGS